MIRVTNDNCTFKWKTTIIYSFCISSTRQYFYNLLELKTMLSGQVDVDI